MKKNILKFSFMLLAVFVFGSFIFPSITLADTLGPNNPATATNDTAIGTISWINPSSANVLDTSYTTTTLLDQTISNYLKVTNYGFNIPNNAIISGIKVDISREASLNDRIKDSEVKIIKNGTIGINNKANDTFWAKPEEVVNYGNSNDLWGETWTANDINSSNFGVSISAWNTFNANVNRTASINSVQITVTYTIPIVTHTLTYTSGPNGSITGTLSQIVNDGADGTSVTAVADTGFHFVNWNDTLTTATRTDTNVTADKTVTANFEIDPIVPNNNIEKDISLKDNCEVKDKNGEIHIFPKNDSSSKYLGICVLAKAKEQKFIDSFELTNDPSLGIYVQSINDIKPNGTEYWALWKNGGYADCGIGCLPILKGDTLSLVLTDWVSGIESTKIIFHITELVLPPEIVSPPPTSSGGGSSGGYIPPTFNIQNALAYLKSVQNPDGSFGSSLLYTDWAAIAFGALKVTDNSKDKLLNYFNSNNTLSSILTDNERHAMALLALGQNPYSFNGVDYIKAITNSFDGTQFGDVNLINDDIFALIPLKNSGYIASDDIIIKDIIFIILKQKTDGSWEESVDVTAATIQALKSFDSITGVTESLSKATSYLTGKQNNDGGFGDSASSIYSTSWVMQAMSALSASWTKNGKTGIDYLATQQTNANNNGAVLSSSDTLQNNIWATSYAIAGANLKPWNATMQNFPKPVAQNNSNTVLVNKETNPVTTATLITAKKITSIPKTKKPIVAVSPKLPTNTNTSIDTPEVIPDTLTATAVSPISNQINSNIIAFVLGVFSGVIPLYFLKKFFIK